MPGRLLWLFVVLSLAASAVASDTLLYEDFENRKPDGWRVYGERPAQITAYKDNTSLRFNREGAASTTVTLSNVSRVRIGASFAAYRLEFGEACVGEATFDSGKSWFEVVRVGAGQDDGATRHAGAVTHRVPAGTAELRFRAYIAGNQSKGICWLDNVYVLGESSVSAAELTNRRALSQNFLTSETGLADPVSMREYEMPATAAMPKSVFSGSLRLSSPVPAANFKVIHDPFGEVTRVGDPIRQLPEFDFQFAQRGNDLVPLRRGVIRREHPRWEVILQPGKAWNEAGDGDWTRASVSFSLQERSANCTHNGVLMWLFNDAGEVSRAVYQISSETCAYFKFDMWGVVDAAYEPLDLSQIAAASIERLDAQRINRLPIRPLADLATDYPGVEPLSFGVEDGMRPDDVTVLGVVVNGINYRSTCPTRAGPHPYCTSLPLPSYSTAKSILAGIGTMRLEELLPGSSGEMIGSLIDECDSKKWRDVTIEDALDMATGNFRSVVQNEDEYSAPLVRFLYMPKNKDRLKFACNFFARKAKPGTRFVYHTSDTYLVGVALNRLYRREFGAADFYAALLVEPIWRRLNLSSLLDDTKRTYDQAAQPFIGYGLTYEADDVLRIAVWLQHDRGRFDGDAMLDDVLLDGSLQRLADDHGLEARSDKLRYNNGFWAFNAGPSIGCPEPVWVPFLSGYGGISVVMFPNEVIYYVFSDSHVHRWQSAREAANAISSLCQASTLP